MEKKYEVLNLKKIKMLVFRAIENNLMASKKLVVVCSAYQRQMCFGIENVFIKPLVKFKYRSVHTL